MKRFFSPAGSSSLFVVLAVGTNCVPDFGRLPVKGDGTAGMGGSSGAAGRDGDVAANGGESGGSDGPGSGSGGDKSGGSAGATSSGGDSGKAGTAPRGGTGTGSDGASGGRGGSGGSGGKIAAGAGGGGAAGKSGAGGRSTTGGSDSAGTSGALGSGGDSAIGGDGGGGGAGASETGGAGGGGAAGASGAGAAGTGGGSAGAGCDGSSVDSWDDEFDSSTLGSEWNVWEFNGQRMNGQSSPANHFLTMANPGVLRYVVDPMTYPGAMSDYAPSLSTYWYDPGIEISRPIGGSSWRVDIRATWYVPLVVNSAGFNIYLRFGPGSSNSYSAQFWRFSYDDSQSGQPSDGNCFRAGMGTMVYRPDDPAWFARAPLTTSIERFLRFERSDATLTIQVSADEQTWVEVARGDIPDELRCEAQSVVFSGSAWFNPSGSYADYDYVRFERLSP